jgi:putative ABC transport system permease protein
MARYTEDLIHRLVLENLKHRPLRTLLSIVLIGAQVTMILTLVGLTRGVLGNMQQRARGTGADIVIRPPESNITSLSMNISQAHVPLVRKMPHVTIATGVLVHPITNFDTITGIDWDDFSRMSGLKVLEGKRFQSPDDLLVDRLWAKRRKLSPGMPFDFGHKWAITGVVEEGKLSATFADLRAVQDIFGEPNKISMVYVKVDQANNIYPTIAALKTELPGYMIYSMEEFLSLFTADAYPLILPFTRVVVAIAAIIGLLVVFLSMYMAVLERTREIGILKAMGATPAYILGILLRETVVLGVAGTLLGIAMTYGSRALMAAFAPNMPQLIVPDWYPLVAVIAIGGALVGAIYPGLKAAKQDAIEALAYD